MLTSLFRALKCALLSLAASVLVLLLFGAILLSQEAPERFVSTIGRTLLVFGGFLAGALGAKSGKQAASGISAVGMYLVFVLCVSLALGAESGAARWVFLGLTAAGGLLGSLLGGAKHGTKRIKRRAVRRRAR